MGNAIFYSSSHGELMLDGVVSKIKAFLEDEPSAEYSLIIGSDSQEKNGTKDDRSIQLVTAVVVHRKGFGGKYFWKRSQHNHIHTIREKIYAETMESLNFAMNFVPLIKRALNGTSSTYNLEIHVDVGDHGQTRDMIKEVVGMVTGNGFVAKTKPQAYGATYVADKHT
ncbi:MAG: hypothetical protein A3F31_05475 [Candidatus Levybacteria bacterium RIFCSPHIGHO2_12_FULL_38_12]|nr:MAG: hypothetical protein A2770_02535 [Candidatus Levybacteria bacterium RIFCSPHIGHO2_01_FULL_38_12]OGH22466.1 MAG: hypothetical protein A3F31_05475 [Candidatus Levybacteria bacterium RIFCSPHIGHO2_12_FULL_38_12]OGH44378.1 MAG: hypothetical protein A3J14_02240 [Candidatus Levybacteria bacterium RIFCSPLOWO2_02_FULL_37_18]OGH52498.1 MAG: hypothetical protein A3G13_02140 [Candidatus Levybacteria bacterium RIFCSPLOWO2_12_FULL_37_7]